MQRNERAVSPVIGVILMVAITVILAAVIGTFAFRVFDREINPSPQATFVYDYDESANTLTVTFETGDAFRGSEVTFERVSGSGTALDPADWSEDTEVSAGVSVTIENVESDNVILLVWADPRARDTTAIIGRWEGPDA